MGMEGTSSLSAADVALLTDRKNDCCCERRGNGWFGDDGGAMWIFFLFFLLAWGGNGFGGGFGNNAAMQGALTRADMCQEFNFNDLQRSILGVQNGLCDGFYAMNNGMLQGFNGIQRDLCTGFNGVNANITQLGYQMQNCCCETNRNIDAVRYENARNTCDIMQNNDRNTQRIIDTMTQNTIQELRDNLQAAQLQLGNMSQTQTLINELRPCAKPAYLTCSPYQAQPMPYYYGYNDGCGNCGRC